MDMMLKDRWKRAYSSLLLLLALFVVLLANASKSSVAAQAGTQSKAQSWQAAATPNWEQTKQANAWQKPAENKNGWQAEATPNWEQTKQANAWQKPAENNSWEPTATPNWQNPTATPNWENPTATPNWENPAETPNDKSAIVADGWKKPVVEEKKDEVAWWAEEEEPVINLEPTPIEESPLPVGNTETLISIEDNVKQAQTQRLGINIGSYSQYGSAQFLKNVIPNPGFESGEFAMMFLTNDRSKAGRIQPNQWDAPWDAQSQGFWDGAQYEFLSGPAKGSVGIVNQFKVEGGSYTFYLNGNSSSPEHRDAVVVRKPNIEGYFTDLPTDFQEVAPNEVRPGSPGKQSLRLFPSGFQPSYFFTMDSFSRDADAAAGKMRVMEGTWEISVWVKSEAPGQTIEIKLQRVREQVFFEEVIPLTTGWQKIERYIQIAPGVDAYEPGAVNPINLELRIASGEEPILIDDIRLASRDQSNPTAFSDKFVNALRELNPGVIRNWGSQLGSSLDNQLASPWARKTNGSDPYEPTPDNFHYSLHEFLELAQYVNAEPWYVIPPTWSQAELRNLIEYLSGPASTRYGQIRAELGQPTPWSAIFPVIHLEYGNEMWGGNTGGDPFRGATLWDGYQIGEVGNSRLAVIRGANYFESSKYDLILGGQAGFAGRQAEIESRSTNHDTIAVAPYWGNPTKNYGNDNDLYYSMYAFGVESVAKGGRMYDSNRFVSKNAHRLAIYEINSHLTAGSIPVQKRNEFVTSLPSGIALPLHMLTYQKELGVKTQAAFTALQFSFQMPSKGRERVSLWGLMRDIEGTGLKRPGWLAMELVNKAIQGNMLVTKQFGENPSIQQKAMNGMLNDIELPLIHSFAFRSGNKYSLVLFNINLFYAKKVKLDIPTNSANDATMSLLTANNYRANNEQKEQVAITSQATNISDGMVMELPANSITVLEWTGQ